FVHQSVGLGNARRWRERDFVCPSRARTRHIGGATARGYLLRSWDCAARAGWTATVAQGDLLHQIVVEDGPVADDGWGLRLPCDPRASGASRPAMRERLARAAQRSAAAWAAPPLAPRPLHVSR